MTDKPSGFDPLDYASLMAHQLQSPISAAAGLIKTMMGGYVGPLTEQQSDLVAKANARLDQARESVARMLAISRALSGSNLAPGATNLPVALRAIHQRWAEDALKRGTDLTLHIAVEPLHVPVTKAVLDEVFEALLSNAFKYTPERGAVRIRLDAPADDRVVVRICDSGVGIPEQEREKIFEPFHRSSRVSGSARKGVGLGLAFVRTVVEAAGGRVGAERSELGGASLTVTLPVVASSTFVPHAGEQPARGKRVVIIGGVAAGPKVAGKVIRLDPNAEVTVVDKGRFLSYSGCGLPYYVSGLVDRHDQLMSTPVGVVRDAVFFQKVKNVSVLNNTEAVAIDRAGRRVQIRDLIEGREAWLEYDKLVLATGAGPVMPQVPGVDLANIYTLHGVQDAEGIRSALASPRARDVVVVGGGLIGVELTTSLVHKGCRVTILEARPQIMAALDEEMARLVELHMESQGVRVLTDTRLEGFEGEAGAVRRVRSTRGTMPADLVILASGVRPNVSLAREAGLEIGPTGGLKVDEHLRTSDPDIYAAGDCVENTNLITGRPTYVPLGSTANRQGRAVAINLCGGEERFPGVLGSTVCRVFDFCVGRTGLSETAAREAGFEVVTALVPGPDAEHFMPSARPLLLKVVADARSRRLLGLQAVGPGRGDKRIDVAAMAITAGATIDTLANLDLCYAPHYSPVMDNLQIAVNVLRNKLDGHLVGISARELKRMLDEEQDFLLLDARTPAEYEKVRLPRSTLVPLGSLRSRLDELPRKPVVTFCNLSLRGYEAALILKAAGFEEVRVLEGGLEMWPYAAQH